MRTRSPAGNAWLAPLYLPGAEALTSLGRFFADPRLVSWRASGRLALEKDFNRTDVAADRFVDGAHNPNVGQAFQSRRLGLAVLGDASGKVVHFAGKLVAFGNAFFYRDLRV